MIFFAERLQDFFVERLRDFLCVKRFSSEKKLSDENVFGNFFF